MKMRMNQNGSATLSTGHRDASSTIGALLSDAAAMVHTWRWRRREHRTIRSLDNHMLRDIGVDRFTAEQIGKRTFWKA